MRYALIDLWAGQRVLLTETDVQTMQRLANAAINHHRPEPVPAVPCVRPSGSGAEGEDREERGGAPLQLQGWAWLEQGGRIQLLIDSCPCGAVSVIEERDGHTI